jgi:hypothetical protein
MVQVGTVALDGTKLAGNAADKANRTLDKINAEVAEILRQAGRRGSSSPGHATRPPTPRQPPTPPTPTAASCTPARAACRATTPRPVATCEQVIVAAEPTQDANDLQQLDPMLKAITTTLAAAGIQEQPDTPLADSGYWSIANLTRIPGAPELLIPPAAAPRPGRLRGGVEAAVRHPQSARAVAPHPPTGTQADRRVNP